MTSARAGVTQAELASRAGTSQPTIAAYESGRKSPTLRTLDQLARAVGYEIAPTVVPTMTREDRRSLALHRALALKLAADPDALVRRARRTLTRMQTANPSARPLLVEWARLLRAPLDQLLDVLVDPRAHARDLRQVTPFAGVLSATERAVVYRRFRHDEAAV